MSDVSKAVFLSYASQDAEAAKRICEALRAAGVEVWFDQSELVGGDAWDAKIRGQIASCALFVPMISAATQARLEGYFRIEWKLAAQRTYAMADEKAFLLPAVIDDTRDADAKVPPEFKAVQWSRLPGGAAGTQFCARVKRLTGVEAAATNALPFPTVAVPARAATSGRPASKLRLGVALLAGLLVVVGAAVGWRAQFSRVGGARTNVPVSESGQWVAKAWQVLSSVPEPTRGELEAATEYCKRAVASDPTDADVWAAWSQVETWYVAENLDISPERRESARAKAAKALNLAPHSYEARLAQAVYLVRGEGFDAQSSFAAEAEQRLRELLKENPEEPRTLLALGHLLRNSKRIDDAGLVFDRLALNPAPVWKAAATNAKGWMFSINGQRDAAAPLAAESVAAFPFYGNVALQVSIAVQWQGDLDLAKAALLHLPAAKLQEDDGASLAYQVYKYRREPEEMLRVLNTVPRDWLESLAGIFTKSELIGDAQQMAGNHEAAELAWRAALRLYEQRLANAPGSGRLYAEKGELLWSLGDRAGAAQACSLARQLGEKWAGSRLRPVGEVVADLEKTPYFTWAELRYNPYYDWLRADPRFQALLAAAEKDPIRAPREKWASAAGGKRP